MPVTVYVDGASRGQGVTPGVHGEGAVGVVIYKNNQLVGHYGRGIGKTTNNAAELEAILTGVMLCWANPDLVDPIIYSDSQLACNLVNRHWFCNNDALRPILLSIHEIQEVFRFRVIQVPRKEVGEADIMAKRFLDKLQNKLVIEDALRRESIRKRRNRTRNT